MDVARSRAVLCFIAQSCPALFDPMDCRLVSFSVLGESPGKNTTGGCHALLQETFPTQGSTPGLPHCRRILYQLSHQRSPRILEWVAHPFFRGTSWSRNWTGVSCISGGFFTSWATREAPLCFMLHANAFCVCIVHSCGHKKSTI